MKKLFLYINLLSGFAYSQWNIISPSVGLDHSYKDVHFINADSGFVIGSIQGNARILRTKNGGIDWDTTLISDVTGDILMSPYSICFPNDSIGYIAGGWHIIKTINYGETWFEIDTGNVYENTGAAPDIMFINKDTGFVGWSDGGAGCLRTYDGGLTWTPDPIMLGLRSFNSYNGTITACWGGYGILDLSTLNWTIYDGNMIDGSGMYFKNSIIHGDRIMIIGEGPFTYPFGLIAWSDDGGVNWQHDYYAVWGFGDIQFRNDTLGYVSGTLPGTLRTFDGGLTWHHTNIDNLETGMSKNFRNFHFVNDTVGYAVSQNGIYKTTNGGGVSGATVEVVTLGTDEPQIDSNNELKIYPNPVQNEINLSNIGIKVNQLTIYSIDGREVFNQKIENQNSVDVSDLPAGIYVVKVISDEGIFTVKILKE